MCERMDKTTNNDSKEDDDDDHERSLSARDESRRSVELRSARADDINHQGSRQKTTGMSVNTKREGIASMSSSERSSYKDIIARIVERRLQAIESGDDDNDSVDSYPRDPLERLQQIMREEEESTKSELEENKEASGTEQHKQAVENNREKSNRHELSEDEKSLVRRIVELRLASIEAEEGNGDYSISSEPPKDPILRVMNMNAEDTLIAAASLLQFVIQPETNDDEIDAVVCNRDIFELNTMIQHNDLEELGRKAVSLAQSFKYKLDQSYASTPVPPWNDTTLSIDTSEKGYLALTRDAVNRSHSSEVSKVDDDDVDYSGRHRADDGSSHCMNPLSASCQHNVQQVPGIRTAMGELGYEKSLRIERCIESVSPRKTLTSGQVDIARSGWWGVVNNRVTFHADTDAWESDSQSSLSNVSTSSDKAASDCSKDESMRMLPIDGEIDWTSINNVPLPRQPEKLGTASSTLGPRRESALDAKRRKKRELEALKISITKSVEKRQVDTWKSSVVQSIVQ